MKLTNDQFEALAYVFERENGNLLSDFERKIIEESGIADLNPELLERKVVDGLNNEIYKDSSGRINAYWALGKRFNVNLIPAFQNWLQVEFNRQDNKAVYQLLISLDNLDEPIFGSDREGGSASHETELNMRDAEKYLSKSLP